MGNHEIYAKKTPLNVSCWRTVNWEIFARIYFRETSRMRSFAKIKTREMKKTLCPLLIQLNHAKVANLYLANMSFNAFRENKILEKISEFTEVTKL